MARREQELLSAAAAEDRRRDEAEDRPAERRDSGADLVAGARERGLAPDPALDDVRRADLELRFDEADEPRGARQLEDCGSTSRCEMKLTS